VSKILAIQHVRCETLGTIADVLNVVNISPTCILTFDGQSVPSGLREYDGLIIMGGSMGVYEQERYPFLRQEIRLIEEALRKNIPVLGVCLGSQLLAATLGAPVTKGKTKEIGWYPVTLAQAAASDPLWTGLKSSFTAYHWHGDIFELPSGAVSLASSDRTPHQAFRYGRSAYGVLFHMEVTKGIIEDMVKTFNGELQEAGLDGLKIIERAGEHLPQLREIGRTVFNRWTGLVKGRKA
jgi:GMP synthase (glutamine-hydrolysing)